MRIAKIAMISVSLIGLVMFIGLMMGGYWIYRIWEYNNIIPGVISLVLIFGFVMFKLSSFLNNFIINYFYNLEMRK